MATIGKGSLLYGAESKGDTKGASQFVSRVMHAANAIHMHHLMVEGPGSFAQHMALGVYGDLRDAVDGLAEAWMGCTGQKLSFTSGPFDLAASPLDELQKLYAYLEQNRQLLGTESHIQNEVDTLCTLVSSTLYKLTRLA